MVRMLNTKKDIAVVTPPWQPADFDRAAQYKQDGHYFDQAGRIILPGKAADEVDVEPEPEVEALDLPAAELIVLADDLEEDEFMASAELILGDDMPSDFDSALEQLKALVKKKVVHPLDHDANGRKGGSKAAKKSAGPMPVADLLEQAAGMPWAQFRHGAKLILGDACPRGKDAIVEALQDALAVYEKKQAKRQTQPAKSTDEGKPAATTPKPGDPLSVEQLGAWGRGENEFLFGLVQKSIRVHYHRQVAEPFDAVAFLIEEGVVSEARARATDRVAK